MSNEVAAADIDYEQRYSGITQREWSCGRSSSFQDRSVAQEPRVWANGKAVYVEYDVPESDTTTGQVGQAVWIEAIQEIVPKL
jgi:hypothetical protein